MGDSLRSFLKRLALIAGSGIDDESDVVVKFEFLDRIEKIEDATGSPNLDEFRAF